MTEHRISPLALRKPLPAIPRTLPRNVSRGLMLALTNAKMVNQFGKEIPLTQAMIESVLSKLTKAEQV
ncbi:hypothetical protein [Simiduia agarivorans]|uniref:Uncharacterized protein n=1 Tax=Simiduia agarivorans (strain DSM 21679 / JCM 13881 / BCRC 17597 / SA1) TaxID=1117647 RepID=K4KGD1_SIMAS|nr:hypothetical protein [Simiduia agarivorans]AFU98036.1 hypothetical protein M5M_04145 [Simiduia agarivorans SA1 = DSM 21679]